MHRPQNRTAALLAAFGCALAYLPAGRALAAVCAALPLSAAGQSFALHCAAAPLAEELVFRGAVQGQLQPLGPRAAVCVQAALFAVQHGGAAGIAYAMVLGVLLVIGTENGGAKNWIKLGGISVQPSEFVKVALVFVMANHFTKVKRTWDWLPSAIFAIIVAGLLVAERDLGAALLICGTYLIMFYTATGKIGTTLVGLGAGAAGAVASYYMFDHVKARVAIWLNPWATYSTSGYQIAQGLMAIASGGLWGLGLTKGLPKSIPAYNTDYIFAVICEEFGIVFGIAVIALYLVFIIRGALIALNARSRYLMLVAFGCTVLITLQSFIIIAGVIKLIPLTGITMPFVSYGGSSMIACMMLLGILEGVSIQNGEMLQDAMYEAGEENA